MADHNSSYNLINRLSLKREIEHYLTRFSEVEGKNNLNNLNAQLSEKSRDKAAMLNLLVRVLGEPKEAKRDIDKAIKDYPKYSEALFDSKTKAFVDRVLKMFTETKELTKENLNSVRSETPDSTQDLSHSTSPKSPMSETDADSSPPQDNSPRPK